MARVLTAIVKRTMVNRLVGGLTELPFLKDQSKCNKRKLKWFT